MSSTPACKIATFTASDRHVFRYRRFDPPGAPKADVVFLHGIQSHGGWYEYSCDKLCNAGFAVWFLDRRGSGLNTQARGDTPSFARLLDDVAEFLRTFAVGGDPRRRRTPLILGAISWGGKLALGLLRRQPGLMDGLMLLCPGLFAQVGIPFPKRLAILATRLVAPTTLFPIPLNDPELFTATPRWREFIGGDPLSLHAATARFLVESVRLDRYIRRAARYVTVPTLLLLAGRDRIIRNDRTQRFFQRFASREKNVITYPGAHHTLEFEPEPDWFIAEMTRWLELRARAPVLCAPRRS
jgi:alpha-beta hydrolase superfamily lysophospholipase